MEYVTVIVFIALAEYLFFMAAVGKARGQCEIKAPATTGNETFERSPGTAKYNGAVNRIYSRNLSMWLFSA